MHGPLRLAYDAVAQLARAATLVAPADGPKFARALADRRGLIERYQAWGAATRDSRKPLLWMHAPSVGEGLMARPILVRLREERPGTQLAFTWYSPSAVKFAAGLDVDFRDYLPLDTVGDVTAALDALRPRALVYSKLDVWPNLTRVARARGVRLGLVSGALAADSSRRSGLARALLRDAYLSLDAVGAVDAADAERLVDLGVRREVIQVTGDTRYDQVWDRTASIAAKESLLAPLRSDRPLLIAGSTWPADEAVLLPSFAHVQRASPEARIMVAPHEPNEAHTAPIFAWARQNGLRAASLSEPTAGAADVIVVDRVGVLGDLYALASIAYVGGGFHGQGLHSVLEPAAFGVPVLVGPRHHGSRDALALIRAGGAAVFTDERSAVSTMTRWLRQDDARRAAGEDARAVVRDGLGAAERSLRLVASLLD
ncbi:MAG TPA: glycosyltransferase N-terminal domain-containing protein [Gemmatimonadaceae bacterium]|nr:glycosyltransferase N-terminal domain-containing protein [Gemmatimonadaceae bacterium]